MAKVPETSLTGIMQLMVQMRADDKAADLRREQDREARQLEREETRQRREDELEGKQREERREYS